MAAISSLKVRSIESPPVRIGMSSEHRVRPLVLPIDPAQSDPFLALMEDWYGEGVFDDHPHRGIETVSYILEGTIEHYDNHGNRATLRAGDVLWLTAGRGIVHNERPLSGTQVHLLQLWVNSPRASKMVPAGIQALVGADMPTRREPGSELRVFSGASGQVRAATKNHSPVLLIEARVESGASVAQEVPAHFNGFVLVLEGKGAVGAPSDEVTAGQIAWLTTSDHEGRVALQGGSQGMRALLVAGLPLCEPVVSRGPFVMNSMEEIQQAYADFARQREHFGR